MLHRSSEHPEAVFSNRLCDFESTFFSVGQVANSRRVTPTTGPNVVKLHHDTLPNHHILPNWRLRFLRNTSHLTYRDGTVFGRQQIQYGVLGVFLLVWVGGCQSIRLPAIDPSGDSVFLTDRSTGLLIPETGVAAPTNWPFLPDPAFSQPPSIPACDIPGQPPYIIQGTRDPCGVQSCLDGCAIKKKLHNTYQDPIKNGTLRVDPDQTVARVGTEVVLRAGLCGLDGYLVTKQPIEWTMSQESRGHIVSVGNATSSLTSFLPSSFYGNDARKYSGNYAVGKTTTTRKTITRGTKTVEDDFDLAKGENWLSVTSPEAGVSHITVWAPNATNWDQRRKTVTINWVDAEWQFPKPVVAAAGRPATLVTRVRRQSGAGAESMKVRYEIEDDRAEFIDGGYVREVLVDAKGDATVQLVQTGEQGGSVRVNMTLIRPPTSSSDLPDMILAKEVTTVTWAAPALQLRFTAGPSVVGQEDTAIYRFEVSNPGHSPLTNAIVDLRIPAGMRFVNAKPTPTGIGTTSLRWKLGNIAPEEVVKVELELSAPIDNVGVNVCADVQCDEGLSDNDCYTTRVFSSHLKLELDSEPSVVQGDIFEMQIRVTNTGPTEMTGVRIIANYAAGLSHKFDQANPRKLAVESLTPGDGRIAPRETVTMALRFDTPVLGQQCITIEARDGSQDHNDTINRCVQVQPPSAPPADARVSVQFLQGPNQLIVGEKDFYTIEVTNPANVPLTQLDVILELPQELSLESSRPDAAGGPGEFTWQIPRLEGGKSVTIETRIAAIAASPGARMDVSVRTAEGREDHDAKETRIVAAQVQPDRQPDNPPNVNRADRDGDNVSATGLRVKIDSLAVNEEVGQPIVFIVRITNEGNLADRDVELKVTLPESVVVAKLPASAGRPRNGIIRFEPIRTLRAGEKNIEYRIEVRPRVQGKLTIKAEVTSWRVSDPIEDIQDVMVLDRAP